MVESTIISLSIEEKYKLRISAHQLNIEGGRYTFTGLPPEVRKCSQYSMKEIEDEQHF